MSEQPLPTDREGSRQAAQGRAREKTRWWLVLGLVVPWLLLGLVVVWGASLWWKQAVIRRHAVVAALVEADQLRDSSRYAEALAVLEQAQRVADGSTRQQLEAALADLRLVQRLEEIRGRAVELEDGRMNRRGVDEEYEAAFREAGVGGPEEPVEEVAVRVRASAVRAALVAGVDDWAARTQDEVRRTWLLEVARLADPGPGGWGDRFRDPRVWRDRAALERLVAEADVSGLPPQTLSALAWALQRQGGDAVSLLRSAQQRHPADFWLTFQLGLALSASKRSEEAVGYYRAAAALRPTSTAVHINLGSMLAEQGRLEEAVACYRQAIMLDPKVALAHTGLGLALARQGKLEEAMACYRRAIELDPRDAQAHNNLGSALLRQGKLDEAVASYRRAIVLDPKFAQAHFNLGDALKQQGKLEEARECQRRAIELDPGLARPQGNKR
jgi:Flp pilus assembly protein TadD